MDARARRERRRMIAAYAVIAVAAATLGVIIALILVALFD
jgi:hypothetical protein